MSNNFLPNRIYILYQYQPPTLSRLKAKTNTVSSVKVSTYQRKKTAILPQIQPKITQSPAKTVTAKQLKRDIQYNSKAHSDRIPFFQVLGLSLIIFSFGAIFAAFWPFIKLDLYFLKNNISWAKIMGINPAASPTIQINPLIGADGKEITPVNKDFSVIVPSIGINAQIVPGVNPVNQLGYNQALYQGVAHASTSFYPNENGTVYLFSHSTNYEWFVKDLNAVFYLLKNVKSGDLVVIFYLNNRYTYAIRESKVVSSREVSYLTPQPGVRNLILQTCWPPGSTYQRLLIFADLVEEKNFGSFGEIQ